MEIKKGMYVRTTYGIGKVNKVDEETCSVYMETSLPIIDDSRIAYEDLIGEPSYEIIDVIKSGDIVNGRVVENVIYQAYEKKGDDLIGLGNKVVVFGWRDFIARNMIRTVVTTEQLDEMTYVNKLDEYEGMNDPETQEKMKKQWNMTN